MHRKPDGVPTMSEGASNVAESMTTAPDFVFSEGGEYLPDHENDSAREGTSSPLAVRSSWL
jgi:hypothetical protein